MKRFIVLSVLAVFLAVTVAFVSTAGAQGEAIGRTDYKALCEEAYKNAKQTRDIVAGVAEKLKKILPNASELQANEINDALFWFKKAEDLFNKCKEKMDKGEYSKELSIDLNQAWQWYIKAGSAGVRATMME